MRICGRKVVPPQPVLKFGKIAHLVDDPQPVAGGVGSMAGAAG
jgi:hypothetical protein